MYKAIKLEIIALHDKLMRKLEFIIFCRKFFSSTTIEEIQLTPSQRILHSTHDGISCSRISNMNIVYELVPNNE